MLAMAERMAASFAGKAQLVWKYGYVQLYRENRAEWIVVFSGLALILWAVYRMAAGIITGLLKKREVTAKRSSSCLTDIRCWSEYRYCL